MSRAAPRADTRPWLVCSGVTESRPLKQGRARLSSRTAWAVVPVLEAMGIQCIRVERDDELDQAIDSTISASYVAGQGVALILTQKFLGAKAF